MTLTGTILISPGHLREFAGQPPIQESTSAYFWSPQSKVTVCIAIAACTLLCVNLPTRAVIFPREHGLQLTRLSCGHIPFPFTIKQPAFPPICISMTPLWLPLHTQKCNQLFHCLVMQMEDGNKDNEHHMAAELTTSKPEAENYNTTVLSSSLAFLY